MLLAPLKLRLTALLLNPIFLLDGILACAREYSAWRDWSFISPGLRGFSIRAAATSPVMVASPQGLLGSLGRSLRALRIAGLASAGFGVIQAAGSLSKIVPCSGRA